MQKAVACEANIWFVLHQAARIVGTSVVPIGITYREFLHIATSGKRNFSYETNLEKVAHASYLGKEFDGGHVLVIDTKNVRTEGDVQTQATRCQVRHLRSVKSCFRRYVAKSRQIYKQA